MKFIIDRTIWLRGEGSGNSFLLRESDKKMCCVGQMCRQLGVSDAMLLNNRTVVNILNLLEVRGQSVAELKPLLEKSHNFTEFYVESSFLSDCYSTNDILYLNDTEREEEIKKHMKEGGHEVEFIN